MKKITLVTLGAILCGSLLLLPKVSEATEEAVRDFLSSPLPESLSTKEKIKRFLDAAKSLKGVKDTQLKQRFFQAWIDSTNDPDAMVRLAIELLINTGEINKGFALLEDAQRSYASERKFLGEISVAARAAEFYSDFMGLEKASDKLKDASRIAEKNFTAAFDQPPRAYFKYRSIALIQRAYGRFFAKQGKEDEAIESYLKAIQNYEKAFATDPPPAFQHMKGIDRLETAIVYIRLAFSQIHRADLFNAERSLRKASSIYQEQGFPEDQQTFLKQVYSDLLTRRGLHKEANRQLERLLDQENQKGVSEGSQRTLWLRRRVQTNLIALGEWKRLEESLRESDRIAENNSALQRVANNLPARAISFYFNGQPSQAIDKARIWFDFATTRFGEKHFLTNFRKAFYAMTLTASLIEGEREKGLTLFKEAFSELANPKLAAQWNDYPLAKALRNHLYVSYIRALMDDYKKQPRDELVYEAFKVAALGGNSAVEESMSEAAARAKISDPELSNTVRLNQDLKRELQVLYDLLQGEGEGPQLAEESKLLLKEKIAALESAQEKTLLTLTEKFPEFASLISPQVTDLKAIQKRLGEKETFLFILPLQKSVFTLAIHSTGFSYKEALLADDNILSMVNKLRDTLDVAGYGAKAPRFNAQVSHKLYSELIEPHSFSLQGKNRLIVSASGPLARIPFSVLLETPWTENDYRSAPWLGKRFAVSYAPSPASWMSSLSTTASNKASTLLAWGDPLYKFGGEKISSATSINRSGEIVRSTALKRNAPVRDLTQPLVDVVVYDTLPPLPETREEVKKLAEVLGGNPESDLILGDQATRASVLKASESGELVKRGIVVFATHGLISGDLPNLTQPALAMAGTSGEDESPLLTLDDVLSLKMNADWVVLSACNTAAADGKAQEALSGLARGFFYAGSRSLLVTHWSVESDSAMRLTTETFKAYKENPSLTRAEALQKARLIVMNEKKYSHPAFWAPYVLVGEGGR